MGLDSYLYAVKPLSPTNKVEKETIDYLETLDNTDIGTKYGLFLSEFNSETKAILDSLAIRKIKGQVGTPKIIKRMNGAWYMQFETAYWRKFNAIHNYFVQTCQAGIDNCEPSIVPVEVLVELKEKLDKILKGVRVTKTFTPTGNDIAIAHTLLPTQDGFFFGSTDYDYWYFRELRYTQRILEKILKPTTLNNWEFIYEASW